jgi:hypothetical protein
MAGLGRNGALELKPFTNNHLCFLIMVDAVTFYKLFSILDEKHIIRCNPSE